MKNKARYAYRKHIKKSKPPTFAGYDFRIGAVYEIDRDFPNPLDRKLFTQLGNYFMLVAFEKEYSKVEFQWMPPYGLFTMELERDVYLPIWRKRTKLVVPAKVDACVHQRLYQYLVDNECNIFKDYQFYNGNPCIFPCNSVGMNVEPERHIPEITAMFHKYVDGVRNGLWKVYEPYPYGGK